MGSCLLVFLGLLPPVGHFFAAMPVTVGHAVLFAIFAILIGMGVKESAKDGLEMREMLILGLSVLIGNGISYLPTQAFALIPPALTYVFANGLIVGVVLSILLEHILFHKKLGAFLHQ